MRTLRTPVAPAAALALTLVVTGCTGSGKKPGGGGSAPAFATFQPAALVIGQATFTTRDANAGGGVGAAGLEYPAASVAADGARLWIADPYNHRVLGWSATPAASGAPAAVVLGQADLGEHVAGAAASGLYLPWSVHAAGGTLAVADAGNHRVLLFPATAGTGAAAPVVVGWPDLATPAHGCAADRLESPSRALLAGGKLFVVDRGNHRVLVWNAVPTASGTPADRVLGQVSKTTCAPNDAHGTGALGPRGELGLREPTDVWSDGARVAVADRANNRVLVWSTFPPLDGIPADLVLGQPDFTTARDAASATGLSGPSGVTSDGAMLAVADTGHNRVLLWRAFPTASSAPADLVLGQSDLRLAAENDDAQTGAPGTAPTARTLAQPGGVAFAGGALLVSDTSNRRVLVFRPE
ncbi:MAG: hypothetical protein QM704_02435 [Anaeromyxobacteraceae bacterium]